MNSAAQTTSLQADVARDREKRRVALTSVVAAIALTGTKLFIGISTGSLGILSEAAHSGLDLAAAAVTYFAVRASSRPADREHPYGHGKIENLAALFETVLLLVTCIWIVYEAVRRLFFVHVEVEATVWAFAVVLFSIAVDWSRSRALMRVARKYHSQALEADALHFSTDIWSSFVVLIGLVLVRIAAATGHPWLARADAAAALAVAGIVIWVSIRLGRRAINDLMDAVAPGLRGAVERAACVPGVLELKRARIRRSGPESFIDLTITIERGTPLEQAHAIAGRAESSAREVLPGADVVVHIEPVPGRGEGVLEKVRLLASRQGLGAHGIRIHEIRGQYSVELHLEASDRLQLAEAHRRATLFEEEIRRELPWVEEVVTHLEAAGDGTAILRADAADEARIREVLERLTNEEPRLRRPHDVQVRRIGQRLSVSFHCVTEGTTPLADAHAWSDELERRLRDQIPNLERVVIHLEPSEEE